MDNRIYFSDLKEHAKRFSAPMRATFHRELVDVLVAARYGVFIPNDVPRPITDETIVPREVLETWPTDRLIEGLGYYLVTTLRAGNPRTRGLPHIERARAMAFRFFRRFDIEPMLQMGDGSEYVDDDEAPRQ